MGFAPDAPLPPWVSRINTVKKQDEQIYKLFFYLMKELSITYRDLMEMPIPAIFALSEQLHEHSKEQEKQMKKARKK